MGNQARTNGANNIAIGTGATTETVIASTAATTAAGVTTKVVTAMANPVQNAIAIGNGARANGNGTIVMGANARAEAKVGSLYIAYGDRNVAYDPGPATNSTVIGTGAASQGTNNVVIGASASTQGDLIQPQVTANGQYVRDQDGYRVYDPPFRDTNSTVVGTGAATVRGWGSAFGYSAIAYGHKSTAIGVYTYAVAPNSSSVGGYLDTCSAFRGNSEVAPGYCTGITAAKPDPTFARYGRTVSLGLGSQSFGHGAQSWGNYDLAVGPAAETSDTVFGSPFSLYGSTDPSVINGSVAVGFYASAKGHTSVAMGYHSSAVYEYSVAIGPKSVAGLRSTALGSESIAWGMDSLALGESATAAWHDTIAVGHGAKAGNPNIDATGSIAMGTDAVSAGLHSLAAGSAAQALEASSSAYGDGSQAAGQYASALGAYAYAGGEYSLAAGADAIATGLNSSAVGYNSYAAGDDSAAFGSYAIADAMFAASFGTDAKALGEASTAVGHAAVADSAQAIAMGDSARARTDKSVAVGANADAAGVLTTALGGDALAQAANSVALGAGSVADRANSVSVGAAGAERQIANVAAGTADTDAVNVAQLNVAMANVGTTIGELDAAAVKYDDATTRDKVTLGGTAGTTIGNLRAGLATNDAVNVGQLRSVINAFGGASFDGNGMMTLPTFQVLGGQYSTVTEAFAALGAGITGMGNRLTLVENHLAGPHTDVPIGTGGGLAIGEGSLAASARDTAIGTGANVQADSSTAVGTNASVGAGATNALAIGADSRVSAESGTAIGQGASATANNAVALGQGSVANEANTVSVGSAGNTRRVTNVAAGVNANDAANVQQMQAGDAQAVASANAYTDAAATQTLHSANAYTDSRYQSLSDEFTGLKNDLGYRLGKQDERIDRQGAMSSAMMNMAINAANSRSPRGRIGVGAGWQNGESALSVGYSKAIGDRASFSIGGAFSSDDSSAGVGFGIDL